jgi:hypothetical protein
MRQAVLFARSAVQGRRGRTRNDGRNLLARRQRRHRAQYEHSEPRHMRPRRGVEGAVDRGGNRVDGRGSRRAPVEGRSRRWRDCPPFKFDCHCGALRPLYFTRAPLPPPLAPHHPPLLQIAHSPAHVTPPHSSLLSSAAHSLHTASPHEKLGDEVTNSSGDGGAGAEAGGAATARRQGPAAVGLVLPDQPSAMAYVSPLLHLLVAVAASPVAALGSWHG